MVDDVPNEQRLDHLQTGDGEGQQKDGAEREAVRPQPRQIFAEEGATYLFRRLRRRLAAVFVGGVQPPVLIVFDELLVALAGRTSGAHETT